MELWKHASVRSRPVGVCAGVAAIVCAASVAAQQVPDENYTPSLEAADDYADRPVIAIDQAHGNFHQLTGRYAPFAKLARHGGYRVVASNTELAAEYLADIDILVIANSAPGENVAIVSENEINSDNDIQLTESPATGSVSSAFTEEEVIAVADWVNAGGSLFLLADHAPFSVGAAALASRFGVGMSDGYVVIGPQAEATGTIDYDLSRAPRHPILVGANEARKVGSVRLFMGQSLTAPKNAQPLLVLPQGAIVLHNRAAIAAYREGGQAGANVSGKPQAIALQVGKGRIVVSAEAGMFTAQITMSQGKERRFGVNQLDNEAYALNILDWLSGRLK